MRGINFIVINSMVLLILLGTTGTPSCFSTSYAKERAAEMARERERARENEERDSEYIIGSRKFISLSKKVKKLNEAHDKAEKEGNANDFNESMVIKYLGLADEAWVAKKNLEEGHIITEYWGDKTLHSKILIYRYKYREDYDDGWYQNFNGYYTAILFNGKFVTVCDYELLAYTVHMFTTLETLPLKADWEDTKKILLQDLNMRFADS